MITVMSGCPYCGSLNDSTDPIDGGAPPAAGDALVCMYCGHVAIVTVDGLDVRQPTLAELDEVEANPGISEARQIVAAWHAAGMPDRRRRG